MPSRHYPAPLADPWPAPLAAGPVRATVTVPGSKSLTNRYLLLAALADGPSTLRAPLASRDSALMVGALRTLGVQIDDDQEPTGADPQWRVHPPRRLTTGAGAVVDCGLAGTVLRFVPPVAALTTAPVRFDGDQHARTRPVQPLLRALTDLGVDVRDDGHRSLPFTVHGAGTVPGGPVQIDSSASSQFVSALLLAGARFDRGVTVQHSGSQLPSTPHVQMTIAALAEAGVQVETRGRHTWHVAPQTVHPVDVVIEPDLSSAAAFLAAAAATGGTVAVRHWPSSTTQAGAQIVSLLQAMGARAVLRDGTLELTGPPRGELAGVDLDLHDVGELTPVVAALAALASGPSRVRGVAHLRGHETDRLQALATELGRLGGRVSQTEDGLRLEPATLHGGTVRTYGDHRMAMAGAVLGTVVPDVLIEDVGTAGKTVPDFAGRWAALIA